MIKKLITIVLTLLIFSCTKQQDQSVKNETQIISLSPNITEIIYALDADSDLVAVSDFCRYPAEALQKEKIGGLLNPNIEKIVALKPTHLFGLPSHEDLNIKLSEFGLKIIMVNNETINDVLKSIETISQSLNIIDLGEKLNESIKDSLNYYRQIKTTQSHPTAMLIIGKEPGSINNITVAGPNTFLNEIWELIGGKNIFIDLPVKYSQINFEEIIKRNPDLIIQFDASKNDGILKNAIGSEWNTLQKVNAIKNQNMYLVSADYILTPGPRMIKIVKDFKKIIKLYSK